MSTFGLDDNVVTSLIEARKQSNPAQIGTAEQWTTANGSVVQGIRWRNKAGEVKAETVLVIVSNATPKSAEQTKAEADEAAFAVKITSWKKKRADLLAIAPASMTTAQVKTLSRVSAKLALALEDRVAAMTMDDSD